MTMLTERDRELIRAAWSLGLATHETLRLLVSPQTRANTLRRRLCQLHRAGYLTQTRHIGPTGCIWLYGVGPRALIRGEPRPWRPSLAQLEHTLTVGGVLVSLTRPRRGLTITGWQGEAELRAWAAPGAPYPDARITWQMRDVQGGRLVEVDRGTESLSAWRRKLARFLSAPAPGAVLAVTTTSARARRLALVAAELGIDLLATTIRLVHERDDPPAYDALHRGTVSLTSSAVGEYRAHTRPTTSYKMSSTNGWR